MRIKRLKPAFVECMHYDDGLPLGDLQDAAMAAVNTIRGLAPNEKQALFFRVYRNILLTGVTAWGKGEFRRVVRLNFIKKDLRCTYKDPEAYIIVIENDLLPLSIYKGHFTHTFVAYDGRYSSEWGSLTTTMGVLKPKYIMMDARTFLQTAPSIKELLFLRIGLRQNESWKLILNTCLQEVSDVR